MKRFAIELRKFHLNESGESASLSNVLTLTIGALVMVGVFSLYEGVIKPWVGLSVGELITSDFTGFGGGGGGGTP